MWILPLLGYAGVLIGFTFLTLAIASGLYYLSELVEEHTVIARKLLTRLIYTIIAVHILLALIDGFPILLTLLSVASHAVYQGNLRHFPIVKLSDPVFIVSCVLVLVNHFFWFRHFSTPPSRPPPRYGQPSSIYDRPDIPTFTEIASYFGICVWLVPFALFVSLSAGENVLPSMGSEYATGGEVPGNIGGPAFGSGDTRARRKKGLVKAAVDWAVEWAGETARVMGLGRGDRAKSF
ncbi:erv26 superfamily protein [Lecanora helva]